MVYAPELDDLVWKKIAEFLASPERLEEAFKQQRGTAMFRSADIVDAELDRLEARISEAERQVKRLLDTYQLGLVREQELASRRGTLERAIDDWREHQRQLEAERPRWREAQQAEPLACPRCQGVMRVVSFKTEGRVIRRILDHLGASTRCATQDRAPPLAAAPVPDSF